MRRVVLAAVAGVATVGLGAPALADDVPPGLFNHFTPEEFSCDGEGTMVIAANGRSGYVNGEHYLATSFVFTGTFDPSDPAEETQTFTDVKVWPSRGGDEITCVAPTFTETTDEGTFTGDFTVTAVPVR